MREREGVRARRALAVLALIAGMLAVQGLATGHHGATTAPVRSVALAAGDALEQHTHAAVPAAVDAAHALPAGQHDCDGACEGGQHALGLLCVAILLAAAVGGLVRRQRTRLLPRGTGLPRRAVSRTPAPPRTPNLVADLCTSRT